MGEFTHSSRHGKTLWFALHDVLTKENLIIGLVSALIGYIVFEYLRKKA